MRLELLDSGNSGFVQCSSFDEDHGTQERYFVLNQLAFPEINFQAIGHDSPECFVQQIQSLPHCCGSLPDIVHIPEFDSLYLNMNGIIHVCCHRNDDAPHFHNTEDRIFLDIFNYIDFVFRMIKPNKTFFMAVDGVAPRAKDESAKRPNIQVYKGSPGTRERGTRKGRGVVHSGAIRLQLHLTWHRIHGTVAGSATAVCGREGL
ncbi:hypothetical protein MRX96_013594 [Rhipicephalus microplus]